MLSTMKVVFQPFKTTLKQPSRSYLTTSMALHHFCGETFVTFTRSCRNTSSITNRLQKKTLTVSSRSYKKCSPILKTQHGTLCYTRIKIPRSLSFQKCSFQTTSCRNVPPILALIIRPLLRIGVFFFGRIARKWWLRKGAGEKTKFINWIREKKYVLLGLFGLLFMGTSGYYVTHIEEAPITKRSRFIMFSKSQQAVLAKMMFDELIKEHGKHLLTLDNPIYDAVLAVTTRILNANSDLEVLKDKNWTLTLVDEPIRNAFVLPGGHIFIFTGMLKVVENADQLAIIIAHEIAHTLLDHAIEQLSRGFVTDILIALPLLMIGATFPGAAAIFLQVLGYQFVDIFHNLPYSRALEIEADEVGLKLAAKACIDVREASVFWGMMRLLAEIEDEVDIAPWLSTHPDHGDREKHLDSLMSAALDLRNHNKCPKLSPIDPRSTFSNRTSKEHEARFKKRGALYSI